MDAPANVRVEEAGSDASGYRDAVGERRRILHVRGSSPRRAFALVAAALVTLVAIVVWRQVDGGLGLLVLPGLVAFTVLAQLAPVVAWRELQEARFEIGRRALTVHTSPLGSRTVVEGWSARAPVAVRRESSWGRPFLRLASWDLYAERDDGRRVHLTTLQDEESLRFVVQSLEEAYRDAELSSARHPFAVRFGTMPEGVSCEGNPENPREAWRLESRCPRGSLVGELLGLVGLSILVVPTMLLPVGILVGVGVRTVTMGSVALPGLFALAIAVATVKAFVSQLRTAILRWRGRVIVDLAPSGIDLHTTPWRLRPLAPSEDRDPGPISLRVRPIERNRDEAHVEVVHARKLRRLHAPMATDDARYLAKIIETYEAARSAQGSPRPSTQRR